MNINPRLAPNSHATMADVAQLAGVSLKSVSRVVNREPHVSEKLRLKVEAAIAELSFVPDQAARSLAGARSFTIGLILDNPSPNYTMKLQAGVYRACTAHQYHLRIDQIDSMRSEVELTALFEAMLRNTRCDGFILTPPLSDNRLLLEFFDQRGVMYVRIAPDLEHDRGAGVAIDDAAAAALVAQHFWANGHRRFGIVNGPLDYGEARSRREGFLAGLAALGATEPVAEADGNFLFEGGIEAGRKLLAGPNRPTAIFAGNDDSAAGTMVACLEQGLAVPRDISICGFDDSWVAKSVWPYLTTIYQPIEEMGFAAAELLIEREPDQRKLLMLDFHLVERDSVAQAPPAID
ncbi:LacI family DNA-binding transcriptional regulator [Novosphingobium sp. PASSN1]|uniref:LacI family DNA-binding transcriptional regulator n=1 Tax=Novosphingobium sp. PASSN1 TaxID=2015561 RepID=UPI000BC3E923|nr:LacI family DNA-binding transcriptional regulator [Novosphingobium sp. PASSN1]OYU35263.1 MAG: transcriptional regulator [Novosphingobium sp. PASSN1]